MTAQLMLSDLSREELLRVVEALFPGAREVAVPPAPALGYQAEQYDPGDVDDVPRLAPTPPAYCVDAPPPPSIPPRPIEIDYAAHPFPSITSMEPGVTASNVIMDAPPPPPPVAADADVKGVVWDAKVHSSSKALNKDGTWRARRGIQPDDSAWTPAKLIGRLVEAYPEDGIHRVVASICRLTGTSATTVQPLNTVPGLCDRVAQDLGLA